MNLKTLAWLFAAAFVMTACTPVSPTACPENLTCVPKATSVCYEIGNTNAVKNYTGLNNSACMELCQDLMDVHSCDGQKSEWDWTGYCGENVTPECSCNLVACVY
jgi:hypothetical protein